MTVGYDYAIFEQGEDTCLDAFLYGRVLGLGSRKFKTQSMLSGPEYLEIGDMDNRKAVLPCEDCTVNIPKITSPLAVGKARVCLPNGG